MAPSRLPRTSAVLLVATLAVTTSAIDFSGQNDITQTAGTVAPGGETPTTYAASGANGFGNFDSPMQGAGTTMNNVPTTVPTVASSGSGGWSQPSTPTVYSAQSRGSGGQTWTQPTTTQSPSVWTPSGQFSGTGDQGWTQPTSSGSGNQGWTQPTSSGSGNQGWTQPTSSGSGNQGWTQPTSSGSGNQGWTQPTSSGSGNQGWTQPTSSGSGNQGWTQPTSSGSGNQGWTQPTSSGSGNQGWTPSSGTGDQGWSQQTGWTSTASSNAGTPSTGESSGYDDGTLGVDCSGSSEGGESPGYDMSLECSGSDEGGESPGYDMSLECSGSDEEEPSVSTSTTGSSTTTAPTTSSGFGDQDSSSNTATSAASGGFEEPPTTSTASSGTSDQGSSQVAQTSSTASSSNTESSSNTAQSPESSSNTAQSSNTESSATQGGSDATQTDTSTGEHASFGKVMSKSGECVIGDPTTYVTASDVDWIFEHRMGVNQTSNKNWIFDHIVKNKGTLNYCVRWDSTEKLSKKVASKFQAMLERQYAVWNRWLIGYGCWPYNEIKVNMVGFAVKDKSLLDWTDDSLGTIYAGDVDAEGIPQCPQTCYDFFDNGIKTWSDTSGCKGEPFDLSLWPKQGLEGGFGYDWGQEVNLENMLQTIDEEQLTIVAHEIGHGFGLPDFYSEAEKPNADWPKCIMMAASSMTVTDSDGWMLRRAFESIRDRYNFKQHVQVEQHVFV